MLNEATEVNTRRSKQSNPWHKIPVLIPLKIPAMQMATCLLRIWAWNNYRTSSMIVRFAF